VHPQPHCVAQLPPSHWQREAFHARAMRLVLRVVVLCMVAVHAVQAELLTFAQYAASLHAPDTPVDESCITGSHGSGAGAGEEAGPGADAPTVTVGAAAAVTESGEVGEGVEAEKETETERAGGGAFVTMLTNDMFVPGVLALLQSLRQHSAAWRTGASRRKPVPSGEPCAPG
jgi:hypothetical protein